MRAYHVFAAVLTLIFDRRRFVRPRLAWLALAGLAGESAWLADRTIRRGDFANASTAALDVGCVGVGLALCSVALPPDEQFNAVNWMFPVSLMSGVGAASAFGRRRDGFAAATALGAVYIAATGVRSRRFGAATVLGFAQYLECWLAGDLLTGQVRRTAAEIQRLRTDAEEMAAERGRNGARMQLQAELHVGALASLQAVRELLTGNDARGARSVARPEALRLRRALRGDDERPTASVKSRVEAVVERYVDSALRVEFVDDGEDPALLADAADAMCTSLDALLRSVDRRRTESGRVVVALTTDDEVLELTVRHRGQNDGSVNDARLASSLDALRIVGGRATFEAAAGGGALVTLRIPCAAGS